MMCNGLEYRSFPSLLLVCAVWHVTSRGCVWLLCSVCYKHWLMFMESQGISSPPRDHSSGSGVTLGVSRASVKRLGGWCQMWAVLCNPCVQCDVQTQRALVPTFRLRTLSSSGHHVSGMRGLHSVSYPFYKNVRMKPQSYSMYNPSINK